MLHTLRCRGVSVEIESARHAPVTLFLEIPGEFIQFIPEFRYPIRCTTRVLGPQIFGRTLPNLHHVRLSSQVHGFKSTFYKDPVVYYRVVRVGFVLQSICVDAKITKSDKIFPEDSKKKKGITLATKLSWCLC